MRTGQPSRTAMLVAFYRALAARGASSVPHVPDTLAERLLTTPPWRLLLRTFTTLTADPQSTFARNFRPWLDGLMLRVAFIDAVLAETTARQIIILGAGLDTRAWRLPTLRGRTVFEVDHPATQHHKQSLTPTLDPPLADLHFVATDFTRGALASALAAAGHDPTQPTVWIWEGVIMYLDDTALRDTLATIRRLSAPGSTLLAHYHEPEATARLTASRGFLFRRLGEPQIGLRTRATMHSELTRAGFTVHEDAGLTEQSARVHHTPPAPPRLQVSRIAVAT